MNKRLQEWAHMAEIVSSVAVVITVIFLIFEIRGNSNLIRANAFEQSIQNVIDWRSQIIMNEDSLKIAAEFWSYESSESAMKALMFTNLWNIYESAYFSRQYDLIAEGEWMRHVESICSNYETDKDFWEENIRIRLTPEFRATVPELCLQ